MLQFGLGKFKFILVLVCAIFFVCGILMGCLCHFVICCFWVWAHHSRDGSLLFLFSSDVNF